MSRMDKTTSNSNVVSQDPGKNRNSADDLNRTKSYTKGRSRDYT